MRKLIHCHTQNDHNTFKAPCETRVRVLTVQFIHLYLVLPLLINQQLGVMQVNNPLQIHIVKSRSLFW